MSKTHRSTFQIIVSWFLACLLAISTIPLSHTGTALAFKPGGFFFSGGGANFTHIDITERAIRQLIEEDNVIPGLTRQNRTMEEAAEEIAEANYDTDTGSEFDDDEAHFTGEALGRGQMRLATHFDGIIASLADEEISEAREHLGRALHAIQDFYAHSNWVERGNTTINPHVGEFDQTGALLASAAGPLEATCTDCTPDTCCTGNISTPRLTTAYFQFIPFVGVKPANKCSHGGLGDLSDDNPATGGINKDTFDCATSPHADLHDDAALLAIAHTKRFILNVKSRVPIRQFKALLGVSNTLAFAIDTTGSMGAEIAGVRQRAIQLIDARLGTDLEPSKYVLVAVNDPSVTLAADTYDAVEFKNAINSLTASGGGDCPELQNTGMIRALEAIEGGGELVLFTDADARDNNLAARVRALAKEKDVKISPLLTGDCASASPESLQADGQGDFSFSNAPTVIDPQYYQTASETGGQVFAISSTETSSITSLLDFTVRPDTVDISAISDTLSGTDKTYHVPVDSTMTRVTFAVSGTTNVTVKRPNGSTVLTGEPGVSLVSVSGGRIYSITTPVIGQWTVTVNGTGQLSLRVTGESTLNFAAFNYVQLEGLVGYHEGYGSVSGLPIANQPSRALAELTAATATTAQFELRNQAGGLIQTLNLPEFPRATTGLRRTYFGEVAPPSGEFLVYVKGNNQNGNPYQRVIPGLSRPQPIKIIAPQVQNLTPGQTSVYRFQVQNLGDPGTFTISGTDDRNFVSGLTPTSVTLSNGQSAEISLQLTVPSATATGTLDTINLNVQSTTNASINNFAVVEALVTPAAQVTSTVQFNAASYTVNENRLSAEIDVTRTGNTTSATGVDYFTVDDTSFTSCSTMSSRAASRCDYVPIYGTLSFAAGETAKRIIVPLIDDAFIEGNETVSLALNNPIGSGSGVGSNGVATLTIQSDDTLNPSTNRLVSRLSGGQQTPPNTSAATGSGSIVLSTDEAQGQVSLQFASLSSAQTVAHIHGPAATTRTGPVIFTLPNGTVTNFAVSLNASQVQQLKAGLLYFDVHTANFPEGEIRGPLLANPIDDAQSFAREQYYDFLSRLPDTGGLNYWTGQIADTGANLPALAQRRLDVSAAFFIELEYQESGAYVYRLYKAAFGEQASYRPSFSQFLPDRSRVVGGPALAQSKLALAQDFAQRTAFTNRYPTSQTSAQFVDAILATVQQGTGATFTAAQRNAFISDVNNGGRGLMLRNLADTTGFAQAVYNRAFVLTQYFGYLRRDPDQEGYDFWLNVLNQQPNNFRGMVCAFATSAEYQQRFSDVATRTNAGCPDSPPPPPCTTQTISYSGPAVAVPDNVPAGVNIPLTVSGVTGSINDLNFRLDAAATGTCDTITGNPNAAMDHTFLGDLRFTLTSPNGTTVAVITERGGSGNNYCTTNIDDEATNAASVIPSTGAVTGTFRPEAPLSAFDGQNANGTWTLNVSDNAGVDTGSLRRFSLIIRAGTCPAPLPPLE